MANDEQLARLMEGVDKWNSWRREHDVCVDLVGADLHGAHLSNVDLRGANLNRANLSSNAKLKRALLYGANLSGANLYGADLEWANLNRVDLRGAKLRAANFSKADLTWADLSGTDFYGTDLSGANLTGSNLTSADLRTARFHGSRFERAILTNARLWETQRAGWSIKGVICDCAFWDKEGMNATYYIPGEFERLYAEQARIELNYEDGITTFELNTLPALLQHLGNLHPGCVIRLRTIEDAAGGAKVTITVTGADAATFGDISSSAQRLKAAQTALRNESKRAERLSIEKRLLLDEVFPRLLEDVRPHVYIGGDAIGSVIANSNSSVAVNDASAVSEILARIVTRRSELGLSADADSRLERAMHEVIAELRKSRPSHPVIAAGLNAVLVLLGGAVANAAGTAFAIDQWQPIMNQLNRLLNLFRR